MSSRQAAALEGSDQRNSNHLKIGEFRELNATAYFFGARRCGEA
jgi:hypothetical protein